MTFPKDAIGIALDALVLVGKKEAFGGKQAVVEMEFNTTIISIQFLGDNSRGATTQERIEDHITLSRRSKDKFGNEFFRFLSGVVGVFRH